MTIETGVETALALASGSVPPREAVANGRAVIHGSIRRAERLLATLTAQSHPTRPRRTTPGPGFKE